MDIIEIDAASNRRIDEMRELKERVHVAPTSATYKVYIIDEVHMLTKEAFNALLKTLEEPPEHAIFILATTEAHKVPETIISRTQRFTFKPVPLQKVTAHLKQIAKQEKIIIEDQALALIAAHGEGSFRDSISLLDQIRHISEQITLDHVQKALGQAPDELLQAIVDAVYGHDVKVLSETLASLKVYGVQPVLIARQLIARLRQYVINNQPSNKPEVALKLMKDLLQVSAAGDAEIALELALYNSALESPVETNAKNLALHADKVQSKNAQSASSEAPADTPKQKPPKSSTPLQTIKSPAGTAVTALNDETWQAILAAIKARYNTLYGIARMAAPTFATNKITLTFAFAFHQKRLDDPKNKRLLLEIIKDLTGLDIELECLLGDKPGHSQAITKPAAKQASGLDLETISNIFGGAEIVE